jgi:hypothetical protein
MAIVEFMINMALSLVEVGKEFFDFMVKEWSILGTDYTTIELLFGGGLLLVLGWNFTKWLIGLD